MPKRRMFVSKAACSHGRREYRFQDLPSSGAVIVEVLQGGHKSQIEAWTHPDKADIATLSISGNDIGFYPILTACVLRVGQGSAGDCDTAVRDANNKISGQYLFNNIAQALREILVKSGRDDFKIYLTGYPTFFNAVTDSCDYTTFYYWQPGHHWFHQPGNWVYLHKALRMQLNNLVTDLNTMLSQVADSANRQYPSQRVWFVDPNPKFTGHRFCEIDVTEPDVSRLDTWLFLSGWDDNSLPDTESAQDSHKQQFNALTAGTSVTLPDPTSGNSALGQSTD